MNRPDNAWSDPIDALIDAARDCPASDVPSATLAFQKRRLLDSLACIAAGHGEAGTAQAVALGRRWSGQAEASLLGSAEKLALPQAAFVNAVRARALDYCDVIAPGWHPSSSDMPVALAVGEFAGASGLEVLAALAVAQDFAQRINLACQANASAYRGFDSNILGLFSGAVIAARLLALDRAAFGSAVGLAFDFGIGTFQHYQDKTLAVRISQGLVARHAIEAVLMAQAGITGPRRVLGGENGFFKLYAPGAADPSLLTKDLGTRFLGEESTCFKRYSHCSILLALTDAVLAARASLPIGTIERCRLTIKASRSMRMVCGAPYEPRDTPEADAQFSARYVLANALLRGRATPDEFTAAAALAPAVASLAKRIDMIEEPGFARFDQCEVEIMPPQGPAIIIAASHGMGWPENPLTRDAAQEKFFTCCASSPSPAFRSQANKVKDLIDGLERMPRINRLIGTLASPA